MKVGGLLLKRSTGKLCVCVEKAHPKYGKKWIKVLVNGKYSKWTPTIDYEVISESR
tara:strand:+ start:4164 stop:4331 length:168 start_codon:yes stop_codon:yes gene_type:complete